MVEKHIETVVAAIAGHQAALDKAQEQVAADAATLIQMQAEAKAALATTEKAMRDLTGV